MAFAAMLILAGGCASANSSATRHFDSLAICGTPQFADQVERALELLKAKSPAGYALATNQIGLIRQAEHSGMRASHHPPIFDLNDRSAFSSVTWLAGAIAHDSYHSKLYHDYKKSHWYVPESVWASHDAERKCLAYQVQVLKEVGATAREINYCAALTPDYADIPYKQRSW